MGWWVLDDSKTKQVRLATAWSGGGQSRATKAKLDGANHGFKHKYTVATKMTTASKQRGQKLQQSTTVGQNTTFGQSTLVKRRVTTGQRVTYLLSLVK